MKALKARAKVGKTPQALLDRPQLKLTDMAFVEAYQVLDGGRTVGFNSPDPIPLTEIQAYLDLHGIVNKALRLKYLRLIRKLDSAYLEYAKENKPKPTVEKPKLPGRK